MRTPHLLVLLGLLPYLCACGGGGHEEADVVRAVVGNVTYVRYRADRPPRSDLYRAVPATVFGADQSADTYLLVTPMILGVDPVGTVLIGDARAGAVHRFDPSGTHLGSFGRRGKGPGEFGGITTLVFPGDTLAVLDSSNRRISCFNRSGAYLGQYLLPPELAGTNQELMLLPGGGFAVFRYDGRGLSGSFQDAITFQWQYRLDRWWPHLERIEAVLDTTYLTRWPILGNKYLSSPFQHEDHAEFALSGGRLAWVDSGDYRIAILDARDGGRIELELPVPGPVVTGEEIEAFIKVHVDQRYPEEGLRRLDYPSRMPAIGAMLWDDRERLWVMRYRTYAAEESGDSFRFDVFASDGDWLFSQNLPHRPELFERAGYFLSEELADGTPVVRFYRLEEEH
jgi:hypothetical protein